MSDKRNTFNEAAFFTIITVGLIVGLWFGLRSYIMYGAFFVSYYMFKLYEYLPLIMTATEYQSIVNARMAIANINPTHHGISAFMTLMQYHGYVWRFFFIPLMLWWGWKTKAGVVRFKYRRDIKTVYDLIEIQARFFPASAIIRGKNLLEKHLYIGPWRTYSMPIDVALDNKLLWTSNKNKFDLNSTVDEKKMIPIPAFSPDDKLLSMPKRRKKLPHFDYVCLHVDRANDHFASQMGSLWKGADKLPPLERALFAAFCAQAAGNRREAADMINQIAFSWCEGERNAKGQLTSPHYANTSGADELIQKYQSVPAIKDAMSRHAYAGNVLFSVLQLARANGRLRHAEFVWLKPVNRVLWYTLCGEGGQCAYWEAGGPWAHGQVEDETGSKVLTPMVAGAVHEFREVMSREHWIHPGKYSEESQKQLVKDANEKLAAEMAAESAKGKGGASHASAPPTKK